LRVSAVMGIFSMTGSFAAGRCNVQGEDYSAPQSSSAASSCRFL